LGLKLGAAGIAKFVPLFGIFLATRNEMRWKEPIDVQESRAEVGEVLPEESRCLEAKCQESKMKSKYWANQARAAMRSRDHWRDKAQAAEAELQTLRQTLATYQKSTPR
jgi:hypothetical protein